MENGLIEQQIEIKEIINEYNGFITKLINDKKILSEKTAEISNCLQEKEEKTLRLKERIINFENDIGLLKKNESISINSIDKLTILTEINQNYKNG